MYSILETAKTSGVNVYLYLLYLLEEITRHLDDNDLDNNTAGVIKKTSAV